MPRLLNDQPCEVTFLDRLSTDENGEPTKIILFYRLPSTEERIGYQNEQIVRKGNTIKNNMGEARLKYGMMILTGFKDGAFKVAEGKPLSSDPKSPHYDEGWKAIVKKYASDIVSLLAIHVFDASVVTAGGEGGAEEAEDTEKNP